MVASRLENVRVKFTRLQYRSDRETLQNFPQVQFLMGKRLGGASAMGIRACLVILMLIATSQATSFKIMQTTDSRSSKASLQGFLPHRGPSATPVHGWVSGHAHNATLNADFGDYCSLIEHMHSRAQEEGFEFLLFDSSDLIEGR